MAVCCPAPLRLYKLWGRHALVWGGPSTLGDPLPQAAPLFPSLAAGSPSAQDWGSQESTPTHAGSPAGGAASPTPCPGRPELATAQGSPSCCLAALPLPLPLTCSRHPQGTKSFFPAALWPASPGSWPSGLRTCCSMRVRVGGWLWGAVACQCPAFLDGTRARHYADSPVSRTGARGRMPSPLPREPRASGDFLDEWALCPTMQPRGKQHRPTKVPSGRAYIHAGWPPR